MLSFEQMGKVIMGILSGSFISEKWKEVIDFMVILLISSLTSYILALEIMVIPIMVSCYLLCVLSVDTVTINKVDIIQKQLDAIVVFPLYSFLMILGSNGESERRKS